MSIHGWMDGVAAPGSQQMLPRRALESLYAFTGRRNIEIRLYQKGSSLMRRIIRYNKHFFESASLGKSR